MVLYLLVDSPQNFETSQAISRQLVLGSGGGFSTQHPDRVPARSSIGFDADLVRRTGLASSR
jgi:hypothetical protein